MPCANGTCSTAQCVFLNETTNKWSTNGLRTATNPNEGLVRCISSHLTNFAVIGGVAAAPDTFLQRPCDADCQNGGLKQCGAATCECFDAFPFSYSGTLCEVSAPHPAALALGIPLVFIMFGVAVIFIRRHHKNTLQRKKLFSLMDADPLNRLTDTAEAEGWIVDGTKLELGKLIGRGGVGAVYEAKLYGQPVAVKRVELAVAGSTEAST